MASLSHRDDYYETPDWLFNQIKDDTGLEFIIDLCASENNSKCDVCIDEKTDLLKCKSDKFNGPAYCNPPRSINGKIVTKLIDIWQQSNKDIVILLCWNDLGNKYCDYLRRLILKGSDKVYVQNLGKFAFWKDGKPVLHYNKKIKKMVEYPSRLSYFYVWLKKNG